MSGLTFFDSVGPVLLPGPETEAIIGAIQELNPEVTLQDRGSYVRVLVAERCRVTRDAIERRLGREFRLPTDLEPVMSSFKGTFSVSDNEAVWELRIGSLR